MDRRAWMRRIAGVLLLACLVGALLPGPAQAKTPPFVTVAKTGKASVAKTPAKVTKAYKRALQAAMNYANESNPIVVDVSDLKLTTADARHVQYLLHSNGELFFIETYNDASFTKTKLALRCLYDDAKITEMRSKLDAAFSKAMRRVTSSMDATTKILTLHDYLIDIINYEEHEKTAYTGLVNREADCFGYAQTMDYVLRRAGFETDMAYTLDETHAWNLVKVSGKWYHIDLTWDAGYSYGNYWEKKHCHLFLLQPDSRMAKDGYTSTNHSRWWAHHKCTSTTYFNPGDPKSKSTVFAENKYKLYVSGFKVAGLKYQVCGTNKVRLVSVASASQKAKSQLSIPATVTYKKVTYKVVGIGPSALKNAKAKTLSIASRTLTKAQVKNSLLDSQVKKIKLTGAATRKKATYKKYFTQSHCGKRVSVK